jgi:uncharacterized protein (TIGR03437 family)
VIMNSFSRRLAILLFVAIATSVCSAQTYDAAADFERGWTTQSNPNGVWSYGYSSGFASPITLYTATQAGSLGSTQLWVSPSIEIGESPNAALNDGPAFNNGNLDLLADEFLLTCGIGGQYSDLVFTAPAEGSYSVVATFRGAQNGIGTVVGVVANGTVVFSSSVTSDGQLVPFSAQAQLQAGDTIVFSVGPGGGLQNTGLAVTITAGSGSPNLVAAPTSLTFNYQQGGSQPANQDLVIASSGAALAFDAASTAAGGNWLSVAPTSGTTSASLTVSVNAAGLAPGAYNGSITVTSASAGNSPLTVPVALTVTPPPPMVTSLAPPSATAGGQGFTLTVSGLDFLSGATVQWNGSSLATTYTNTSQLTAQVPASLIAAPGSASVAVVDPGGSGSNTATFTITSPTPHISGLMPASVSVGGPPFTLTVNGSGFLSGATVRWNSSALVTSYVNGSQLTAAVPSSLIVAPGSASVTVVNSAGGLASNAATVTVAPSTIFASPQSLNFTYQEGGSVPISQTFSVFSNGAPVKYSVAASANWLKAVAATGQTPDNVTVSLQNLASLPACAGPAPCGDTATVTITPLDSAVGAPSPVNITLTVIPQQPQLSVSPQYLTVSAVASPASLQRQVQVFNAGGGTLNYTVTPPSAPWLTVSCGNSGAVTLSNPASICLTLNPSALQPETYHAPLVVNGGTGIQPATVNVTLQVTQAEPLILLSPGAMEFTAVSGQTPAPQILNVLNIGTGTMDWSAQASTVDQSGWLQLSTGVCVSAGQTVTGSATSGGPSGSLTVCVDLAQAALGANYGQIAVSVPNGPAGNSEAIAVLLNVLPAGAALPELAAPTGVTLGATAGSSAPAGNVTLSNPNTTAIGFTTAAVTQNGAAWLLVSPSSGGLAGQGTVPLQVQGNAAALAAGIYHGQVRVGFGDGTSQVVNVILAVSPASGTTSVGQTGRGRRERPMVSLPNCPGGTVLPPQFIDLSQQGFQVQAGNVQQLLVQVQDSCGNQITDADVGATVSVVIYNSTTNSTTQATLETPNLVYSDTQRVWQYGWTPTGAEVGPVGMYAVAGVGVGDNSIGNRSDIWSGTVTGAAAGAAAEPIAVSNAASANLDTIVQVNQVAVGSYITIYGYLLADPPTAIPYPFPTEDQGSTVLLGGVPLLLEYVSPTQVNALVPATAGLPLNAPLPLKIERDGTLSVNDLQVSVTAVQPAIYLLDQNSQGAVLIAGTADVAAPVGSPWPGSRPAQAGVDYIEIFCNGLGPVTNPPPDGQAAPANPLSWTTTLPTVMVGGVAATVQFSGLSPYLVALYQVNVQVPAGSQTGNAVPVVLQMGDVQSNTVTIAIQ